MSKKILFVSAMLLLSILTHAQVSMTLQVPPFGVLIKTQLWNMLLINTSSRSATVRMSVVLTDQKTGLPALTGTTLPFVLDKGAKQVQAKDLGPIDYTYNGAGLLADHDPNGMLPLGNYQACYTVTSSALGVKNVVALENCISLAVDPLSPPLLNTPADEGSIYTSSPQFTWLPPTPPGIFGDLSYDLVLVEVLPGQGKADAIQQNVPVYAGGLIRNLYLNYATSYTSLDTGKLYAWRIVAMNNGSPAAMSDIWTFRVTTGPLPTLHITHSPYLTLKRELDPSVATGSATMRFNYDNVPADTSVRYTITSLSDPGNPVVQQGQLTLVRGENLLEITLSKTAGYDRKKIYLFRLVNGRNESWNLKFTGAAQ
jgi:hypothetical protein